MSSLRPLLTETLAAAKKHGIISDVIDSFDNSALVKIGYGSKNVEPGVEYAVSETQVLPKVEIAATSIPVNTSYTLLVTDPDAPRRGDPTWSEYAHYLVTDIVLDPSVVGAFQSIDFSKARTLLPYMGPGPPPKTGLHRYVFLLFEGSTNKEVADRPNWGFGRPGAGVRDWLEGQSLKPVGLNFFLAKNVTQ